MIQHFSIETHCSYRAKAFLVAPPNQKGDFLYASILFFMISSQSIDAFFVIDSIVASPRILSSEGIQTSVSEIF
jgi:hypothetical protein